MEEQNITMKNRFCKQCLMRDMIGELEGNYINHINSYLSSINPDDKAIDAMYEGRLAVCTGCELLADGLCRACGCFVEMRAALTKNKCPYKKW